jgi:hypothetical protein
MPTIPAGAKQPTDKIDAARAQYSDDADRDQLLEGLPESLTASNQLFIAQRNQIMDLFLEFEEMFPQVDYSEVATDQLLLDANSRGLEIEMPARMSGNADLVEEAKARELDHEGTKPALITRIHEHDVRKEVLEALIDDDQNLDTANDRERLRTIMKLSERIDDVFRTSIATNREEYDAWSRGKGYDVLIALLTKYAAAAKN